MWLFPGDEPEPGHNQSHHESEEEDKSMQILALVTGVVAASIFFEKLKDFIEESVESEELKPIVRHLFGELTVLGFIGLVIFILDKTGIPKEWTEKTEQIHMVIFVVSLVFLTVVMVLVTMGKTMAMVWRDAEDVIINPIEDRIALIDEFLFAKSKVKGHHGFFGMFSAKAKAYHRAKFQLEYHGLRDAFLESYFSTHFPGTSIPVPKVPTLHHGVSASEARRTAKLLVPDFNLADYLNSCMAEALTEIVEIQASTWFALYVVFIPFWAVLYKFDTPQESIYAFLALPYLMLVALFVIKGKVSFIRRQLVPGFMHEATRLVDMTDGETRRKTNTELESAPLLGSLNDDRDRGSSSYDAEDPDDSLHPMIGELATLGGRRRRVSAVDNHAPPSSWQFIGPEQADRLKSFIVKSEFEFADPETIPYLRQKQTTLNKDTHSLTKWMHGLGGTHAQGEVHSHAPSPHEQLFWYSRNGAHFLLHLIRVIMMLIGIYIAVMSTAIMPALWRHKVNTTSEEFECLPYEHHEEGLGTFGPYGEDPEPDEGQDYCFTFAFQVAYSVVGFLPLFVMIPQFYYIIHDFVIVANVGMMREPKIVSKVYRSGKTRKSLRVLKLLSSMKQGAGNGTGKASPTPSGGKKARKPSKRLHEMEEAAREAFELIDDDSSGCITHEELGELLEKLHLHVTDEELQKTVHALDDDNSGTIDESEFMAWIATVNENAALDLTDPEVVEEFVDIIFDAIDIDGDGNVTTAELLSTLNSLGQKLTFEEVQDIMSDIDKDNSGSVDKEEFLHMIKEHAAYL